MTEKAESKSDGVVVQGALDEKNISQEPTQSLSETPDKTAKEEEKKSFKSTFTFLRLLLSASPTPYDYALLIIGTLTAILAGAPFPLLGILFGQLVDDLNTATCSVQSTTLSPAAASQYQSSIDSKVLQVVYITIGSFFAVYIYIMCWNILSERLAQRLRDTYFRSLLRQPPSFFDTLPAGEVSSRLNGDISTIQSGTGSKVGMSLASISFFVTAYIVAFIKNAKLAGMLVSLLPAFGIMSIVGKYYVGKYAGRMTGFVDSASAVASEALSNVSVVHAFNANARLEAKFSSHLLKAQKAGILKALSHAVQTGVLYLVAYSGNGLAYWQGSRIIAEAVGRDGSGATVGHIYTVILILVDASLVLSQIAPYLQNFSAAAAAFEKLEKDMKHISELDGTDEKQGEELREVVGDIKFENVSFTYPSRPENPVIQDLSLHCPAGKHTAIVGLSGSGKSTIAALIARLYDTEVGRIFLDGRDIKDLNLRHLRGFVSLVQQDPSLLDRSILENIALGLVNSPLPHHEHLKLVLMGGQLSDVAKAVRDGQEITEAARNAGSEVLEILELVRNAASLADAIVFIDRLEFGLATTAGSTGSLLSGGQNQRIALARALIRDPRILILDEATAMLDSMSQQRIQDSIEKMSQGRTLISIAHRLSTVRNADNIIVMRHGRIIEQGTHAQLMVLEDGAYASMVNLQTLESSDETSMKDFTPRESLDTIALEKERATAVVAREEARVAGDGSPKKDDEEPTGLPSNRSFWSIVKSLSPVFRRYLLPLLAGFFASTVIAGSYSGNAIIFGETIGSLSPCNSEETIRSRGALFGLMFFVMGLVTFFASSVNWSSFGYAAEKILYVVRVLSFRSLFEQDLQWHQSENRNPAILLSFITKDGNALGGLTGSIIGAVFSMFVNLLIAVILTHVIAWRIALVCLAVVPLMLGASIMQFSVLNAFEEKHQVAFASSTGITVEAVNSIKTVASLSLEHEILGTYRRSLKAPRKEITKASAYANLFLAFAQSVSNWVYALAYWWGAKQIIAGYYTQTQFFIVVLALLVSAQLMSQFFMLAPDISKARSAVARILNLIDLGSTKLSSSKSVSQALEHPSAETVDVEAASGSNPKSRVKVQPGGVSVSLKGVHFAYPARPQIQVLQGLNVTFPAGKFCALVGPSGAGKSTIISLIERMYTPSSGSISIDGTDIAKRDGVSFRDEIALVPQESVLFDGSIKFNVSLGARPDHAATDEEIEAACRLANIHETIMALPQGYDTNCGPNGNQLSGGQKQRLSIARALVRKPRLLLLDESTSALDAESEQLLQDGLEKASRGITVIAIAHRLHTIRKADVIFLIEGGRCVDQGSHAELFERSESYRVNALHQSLEG